MALAARCRLRVPVADCPKEIRNELMSGATEEDALRLIAQRTLELARSHATVIVLGPDPLNGDFVIRGQCGPEEPGLVGLRLDGRDPLLREVVDGRTAVLAPSPGDLLAGGSCELPPYGSTVAVPLHSQENMIGVLVALRRRGEDAFEPDEVPSPWRWATTC